VSGVLSEVRWIAFPNSRDERGVLTAIEGGSNIPFEVRRIFYMYGTPPQIERGGHAHTDSRQVVIAICGRFKLDLSDGTNTRTFELVDPDRGVFMPRMTWARLYEFSPGAVCLVLADTHYDRAKSIRTWAEFLAAVRKQ